MSELVTRNDLDKALGQAVTTLRGEMVAMENRLSKQIKESASEIAQEVANVMVEQLRSQVSVVDEKYQDLPGQYAALRKDFDAHAADAHLHRRRLAL
jgi:predicted nuclease with TOPRIM domain